MNILDQIKECEQEAAAIRAKAALEAREIVRNGEREAKQQAQKLVADAKENSERTLQTAMNLAQQKADELVELSAQNDLKQAAEASVYLNTAVSFIVNEVQKL